MGKTSKGSEIASKADKKFEKKLQFYAKVRDTVASLSAKKEIEKKKKHRSRQKKLKAFDLSGLHELLPDLNFPGKSAPAEDSKLSCKQRQQLILKEGRLLDSVINDQNFQDNPLDSIHRYLLRTQPAVEEKPKKMKMIKNGSKKNPKKGKASSGPQSMDM